MTATQTSQPRADVKLPGVAHAERVLRAAHPDYQPTRIVTASFRAPDMRLAGEEMRAATKLLADVGPIIGVFGSARTPETHPDYALVMDCCEVLSRAGFAVATGGGPGAMEAANRGAQKGGSPSIGLRIDLSSEQCTNAYCDIVLQHSFFFSRKIGYIRGAAALVAFPGGNGTFDELFESLTLVQTAIIPRLPVVLVRSDYWRGLLDWMYGTVVAEGKLSRSEMSLITLADSPDELLEVIRRLVLPVVPGGERAA